MKNKIKFVGIDSWNRPIFKNIKCESFYGSTDILFNYGDTEEKVLEKVSEKDITWFGNKFGCEPMGTPCNVEIVT